MRGHPLQNHHIYADNEAMLIASAVFIGLAVLLAIAGYLHSRRR